MYPCMNAIFIILFVDWPITEKLDYFSAALSILFGLYIAVVRLFHLYPTRPHSLTSTTGITIPYTFKIWTSLCIFVYLAHITYLSVLPRFDYSYNVMFNLIIGLSHNILWIIYALPPSLSFINAFPSMPRKYHPKVMTKAAIYVLLTTAATGLEIFDFPAWARIIDAHSLWHLATAFIAVGWYDFLVEEALDDGWRTVRV